MSNAENDHEGPIAVTFGAEGARLHGRFYPGERETPHATVLLLDDFPGSGADQLRLNFWLPMVGFNLLTFSWRQAPLAADVAAALAYLRGASLPAGVRVDPDRLLLAGWGAGGGLALRYAADNPVVTHVIAVAPIGDVLPAQATALADRQLLLVGGWNDAQAPLEDYLLPLYRQLQAAGATGATVKALTTDHAFDGRRFVLAKTVWEWMRRTLPAAGAPGRDAVVSLREVTQETARGIMNLRVTDEQRQFVASNEISMAQAYFQRENAWFRAIYADETPVGFLMLYDDPQEPTYFLWRFMIDVRYQGMGYGRRAMDALVAHVKTRPNAKELLVSCVPGEGSPYPFYKQLGFADTGDVEGIEVVMALPLETE